jgi:hypothetical protein
MKDFWVSGIGTVTFTVSVQAETLEEAKNKVRKTPLVDLDYDSEEIEVVDGDEIRKEKP